MQSRPFINSNADEWMNCLRNTQHLCVVLPQSIIECIFHPFISFQFDSDARENSVNSSIENWYLIPIIKINWHFSPTYCLCVCFSHFLSFRFRSIDIGIYQMQLFARSQNTEEKKKEKNSEKVFSIFVNLFFLFPTLPSDFPQALNIFN